MPETRLDLSPEEIVRLLVETAADPHEPRRNEVLSEVRRHFVEIGNREWQSLGDELQDAVQVAIVAVSSPDALASIADPTRFWAWATSVFINTARDLARRRQRGRARVLEPPPDQEIDSWLAKYDATVSDTPEAIAERREILRAVMGDIQRSPTGCLRLLEDLSEEETAAQLDLTRDQVAGQLKRLRARLRRRS